MRLNLDKLSERIMHLRLARSESSENQLIYLIFPHLYLSLFFHQCQSSLFERISLLFILCFDLILPTKWPVTTTLSPMSIQGKRCGAWSRGCCDCGMSEILPSQICCPPSNWVLMDQKLLSSSVDHKWSVFHYSEFYPARERGGTKRVCMKSVIVWRYLGNIEEERRLLSEGLKQFPSVFKLWLMLGQLEEWLAETTKRQDQPEKRDSLLH